MSEFMNELDVISQYPKDISDEMVVLVRRISYLKLMMSDKKVKNQKIRFIGLKKAGKPQWLESVNIKQIESAYERITK
jgi:3-dehydroquinate synthetase